VYAKLPLGKKYYALWRGLQAELGVKTNVPKQELGNEKEK